MFTVPAVFVELRTFIDEVEAPSGYKRVSVITTKNLSTTTYSCQSSHSSILRDVKVVPDLTNVNVKAERQFYKNC